MRPLEHVHRIELEQPDPLDHPAEVPPVDPTSGPWIRETLRSERDTTGLIDAQLPHSPSILAGGFAAQPSLLHEFSRHNVT
jgi:hypothetical protein